MFFEQPTIAALIDALDWFEAHAEQCDSRLAREQAERFTVARYEQSLLAVMAEYCPAVGHTSHVPVATTADDLSLMSA